MATSIHTNQEEHTQQPTKKSQYTYTTLKETGPESSDSFNFFGVIIDAAYPYKSQSKYLCTLKVVDQTYHHKEDHPPVYATVIIYAKRMEDLPVVQRVGDLIRIHRANMKQHGDQKQFHVNVFFNSSWCLFSMKPPSADNELEFQDDGMELDEHGNLVAADNQEMEEDEETAKEKAAERMEQKKYRPYKFSGKNYNFDVNSERRIIDNLRSWADNYFSHTQVITKEMYKLLADVKQSASHGAGDSFEFDLLCKVLKVFEKDENSLEVRIKDVSQQLWFMSLPKHRFGMIKPDDIVRIRSVEMNLTTKRNVIQVKPYSNILKLPGDSHQAKFMRKAIQGEQESDKLLQENDERDVIMEPIIYTEITDPEYSQQQVTSSNKIPSFKLTDLFLQFDQIPAAVREKNTFKVRFYTLRVDPIDLRDIVQAMCPQCFEVYSCKDLDKEGRGKCTACSVETKLIYKMQLLVKDSSSQLNKNFYRILLYSFEEGKGQDFFYGLQKPVNLWKNAEALDSVKKQVGNLLKYNVWVDALLERRESFFLIKDTRIQFPV